MMSVHTEVTNAVTPQHAPTQSEVITAHARPVLKIPLVMESIVLILTSAKPATMSLARTDMFATIALAPPRVF